MQDNKDLNSLNEMLLKFLSILPVEQRLAGIPPEQRLAGLTPDQQILALSNDVLQGLPEQYLSTLPPHVQETIRQRLERAQKTQAK